MFEKELLTSPRKGGLKYRRVRVHWGIGADKLAIRAGVLDAVVAKWEDGKGINRFPVSTADKLRQTLASMVFERALELVVAMAPPGDPRVAALRLTGKRQKPAGSWLKRHPKVEVIDDESPST